MSKLVLKYTGQAGEKKLFLTIFCFPMEKTSDIIIQSKITADGDRSHEVKRYLLLGRNAMTNLDSVLESREITLPIKIHIVKTKVFP